MSRAFFTMSSTSGAGSESHSPLLEMDNVLLTPHAAYYSSVKMLRALPLFSKVLAIELLMSCQGMDIVRDKIPEFSFGIGTAAVWSEVRRHISVMVSNRFVSPDMNEADRLITGGEVLNAAEAAAGELR